MSEHREYARVFGFLQGIIFLLIMVTLYLSWKRQKERNKHSHIDLEKLDLNFKVNRTPVPPEPYESKINPEKESLEPLKLSSILPTFEPGEKPWVVLGVSETASKEEIEKSYKSLLKKYHPDRFASLDSGYQTRAHQTILLLQKARDEMLAKQKTKKS